MVLSPLPSHGHLILPYNHHGSAVGTGSHKSLCQQRHRDDIASDLIRFFHMVDCTQAQKHLLEKQKQNGLQPFLQ